MDTNLQTACYVWRYKVPNNKNVKPKKEKRHTHPHPHRGIIYWLPTMCQSQWKDLDENPCPCGADILMEKAGIKQVNK
jgi:hypothetical protein